MICQNRKKKGKRRFDFYRTKFAVIPPRQQKIQQKEIGIRLFVYRNIVLSIGILPRKHKLPAPSRKFWYALKFRRSVSISSSEGRKT